MTSSIYNNGTYLSKNADWHVQDSSWKADQIGRIITRNKLDFSSICEIGCGAGEIIRLLSVKYCNESRQFFGYEISEDAFQLCKSRQDENLKYFKQDLLEVDQIYDLLLCIDVVEHVEDYLGFLRKLRLRGKYKIFHAPLDLSVSSLIRKKLLEARASVGHLHYFTTDTFIASLRDCGYEVIDIMYTPAFADLPAKTWAGQLMRWPRGILYSISPSLMSTFLGGASLMVLTK